MVIDRGKEPVSHTPGPWIWEHRRLFGGNRVCVAEGGEFYVDVQNPADARLIAAAPDLLEALEGLLLDWVETHHQDCGCLVETRDGEVATSGVCTCNTRARKTDAQFAIAKARGQS